MSDKSGMRRIQREIRLANLTSRKEATEQQIARLGTDMSPKAVAKREKLEAKLEALNTKIDATKKSSEALAAGTALRNAPHLIRVEEGLDLYKKQYLKKLIAENKKLSPEDKKDAEALEKEASAYIKEHKAAIEKILEEQQTSIASYSGNSLGFISSLDDLTQYELKVEKAKKNNESKKPAQEKEDREEISNSSSTITGAKSEDRSATPKQKEENRKARTAAEKNLKEKGASDEDIKALGELGEFKDSIREAIAALKQPSMLMSTDEEVKNYTYSIVGGIADKLKDADKENLGAIRNDWDKVNSIIENLAQSSNREETLNTLANGLHRISLESVSILQQEREDKIAAESAAMRKTIENIFNKDRTFELSLIHI